ncbi:fatty acid synthase alpha subunit Lsd1, partial [Linderina macrospora]
MTSESANSYAEMEKAGWRTFSREEMAFNILDSNSFQYKELTVPLANYQLDCPKVKTYEQLAHLRYMQDMVDLDKVVVVTGFGEVGSYGNAALRWEMEAYGEFSLEGCVELAWIMGLIKYVSGKLKSADKIYTGWVDSKTEEPVCDMDVKSKYEKHMLEHTGIRPIEPELCANGALAKKPFMRELQIDHDLEPFEATAEEAAHFKLENGDKVDMWANGDGTWSVKLLKGAIILVPKAMKFDRTT